MRANGVDECYCTGNAKPYEKFLAWAKIVPYTLRNPLYHWTHLERLRYFGIKDLLNEETAPRIWREANAQLAGGDLTAQGILRKFNVEVVCSTDDPTDSLEYHQAVADQGLATRVFPTFRSDSAFRTEDPAEFNGWLARLERAADVQIVRLTDLLAALRSRHDAFHKMACRASDHGLDTCSAEPCTEQQAAKVFDAVRLGKAPDAEEGLQFASFMLLYTAHLDAEKGWIKQLHLGTRCAMPIRKSIERWDATPVLIPWAIGHRPRFEDSVLSSQSDADAYYGRLVKARTLTRSAVESALRADQRESAALWQVEGAMREAEFGNWNEAKRQAAAALAGSNAEPSQPEQLLRLLVPEMKCASALERELHSRFPTDTLLKSYWSPSIRAAIQVAKGRPESALDELKAARCDLGQEVGPGPNVGTAYLSSMRGEALLRARQADAAVEEFRTIIDPLWRGGKCAFWRPGASGSGSRQCSGGENLAGSRC